MSIPVDVMRWAFAALAAVLARVSVDPGSGTRFFVRSLSSEWYVLARLIRERRACSEHGRRAHLMVVTLYFRLVISSFRSATSDRVAKSAWANLMLG